MNELQDVNPAAGQTENTPLWWGYSRIGRLRFLAYGLGGLVAVLAAMIVLFLLSGTIGPMAAGIGTLAVPIVYLLFTVRITLRRTRDMGWSGWLTVLAFLPLLGLIWIFKAGTPGVNQYGPPPPPNTLGIKVAAFGFFVVSTALGLLSTVLQHH